MKNKFFFLLILPIIFLSTIIPKILLAEEVTIAVTDLSPKGVPRIIANAVSDIVRSEFVNIENFTVVERSQMNAILKEQGLQMTGCTDSSCAVEIGKLLSARRIVIGEVNAIGKKVVITIRYVDVMSGKSLFSASETSPNIDDVDIAAKKVGKKLAEKIVAGDKEVIVPKTAGGFFLRGIVPGWGQFYAENSVRGYLFSGTFLLSGCFAGWAVYNFQEAKKVYDGLVRYEGEDVFREKRDSYVNAALLVNVSIGVIAGVYLFNWIDILFFSRSNFDSLFAVREPDNTDNIFAAIEMEKSTDEFSGQGALFRIGMRF